jgi:hypothetical protein
VAWIDLPDIKAHLNKTGSGDDAELIGFVGAACAMVEDIKGHVDVVTVVDVVSASPTLVQHPFWRYNTWQHILTLNDGPVLTVTSVNYLPGDGTSIATPQQDIGAGIAQGWWQVDRVLYVPLSTHTFGRYQVTYQAGLDPVPDNYRLAALELAADLWKTTQMNAKSPGPMGEPDVEWMRGTAGSASYAMPFRVRELLGLYGNQIPNPGLVIG